jgi:hypothetical protein
MATIEKRTYDLNNPADEEALLSLLDPKEHVFYALLKKISDDLCAIKRSSQDGVP